MAVTLGIPRALLYFKYPRLWETFFRNLGVEVVVSPPTNRAILTKSVELAESELCLPLKVFHGHVLELRDKVDAVFVPRVVSVEKGAYTCPKFLGLPDIVQALPIDLPRLISPTINLRLGRRQFYRALFGLGAEFGENAIRTFFAWQAAKRSHNQFLSEMSSNVTPLDLLQETGQIPPCRSSLRVGLVGHSYNLYDSYVSVNLISMLRKYGVSVLVPEMFPHDVLLEQAAHLPKKLYWTYEREVVGAVFYWLRTRQVDGIIYVRSFACGPDSIVQVILDTDGRIIGGIPTITLAIDEHTAEAGVVTRVEAFLDMLERRKVMVR